MGIDDRDGSEGDGNEGRNIHRKERKARTKK